jgi:hypothetical protein
MRNPKAMISNGNFESEALIYAVLILRLLGEPLRKLFTDHLTLYAFVALALIVVQGVQYWNWSLPFW